MALVKNNGRKNPAAPNGKWQQALQLKEYFDSLDEKTAARELKKLSSDDLNSLAVVSAYLNEQKEQQV